MEEKKVKVKGAGKGGGRPFNHRNFKKKETTIKAPTVGLKTIVFSSRKPKDYAAVIKSNKALSRYIGVNFKVRRPMSTRGILSVTDPDLKLPEDLNNTTGKVALLEWKTEFNTISKNKLTWEENHQKLFDLYLQHCTPDMRSKLKLMNVWESTEVTQYGIVLIKMIRSISNQHDKSKQEVMEIFQSDRPMFLTYQNPYMPHTEYLDQFKACIEVIEAYGGTPVLCF